VKTSERGDFFQSVQGLALTLTTIALLAFVLPSVLAARLQQRRVSRAEVQVRAVAERIRAADISTIIHTLQAQDIEVLTGPGDSVLESGDRTWTAARQAPLQSYMTLPPDALAPDPWLRALQINIGARRKGKTVWVLSAGPNGIIDTPFDGTGTTPSGDDVAVPLP
jgi:type II secretory pathway pseudopilin PulG